MTIIIKSDRTAKNYISNAFELGGRSDFGIMLDFNRQEYLVKNGDSGITRLSLEDVVDCSRTSIANYRTQEGAWLECAPNTPRVSYDEATGVGGLLIERESQNHFANPEQPVTQTITLPLPIARVEGAAISVVGSGGVRVTGHISSGSNRLITEDNPLLTTYVRQATNDATIQVEVVGSVDYVQVEKCEPVVGGISNTSIMPKQLNNTYYRKREMATLTPDIAELVAKSKTVVINYKLHDIALGVPYAGSQAKKLLELYDASIGMGDVDIKNEQPSSLQIRHITKDYETGHTTVSLNYMPEVTGTPKRTYVMDVPQTRDVTVAITHDGKLGNLVYAINGASSPTTLDSFSNFLTGVGFGGLRPSVCGLLTKVVAYDDEFSIKELEEVSKAWT